MFYLIVGTFVGIFATYILWTILASPLKNIPGPFIAKFTDAWRFSSTFGRKPEVAQHNLHLKYGHVVRLGPNMISLSDPAMIPEVYTRKNTLTKGAFYEPWDLNVNGQRVPNVFSTRDEQWNTQAMRPVFKYYSMGQMVKLEPLIDSCIGFFLGKLTERFAQPGKPCDIHNWLHYCAWDVVSEITFSERLGFLEQGKDVLNMIAINQAAVDYSSLIGMMPWLDMCLERNPLVHIGPPTYSPAVTFALERIAARRSGKDGHDPLTPDMLDGFIEAQQANPQDVHENALLTYVMANIVAGSDTVAAELCATVYYLCKNPTAFAKLRKELDSAKVTVPVSWAKCQELPYLCACISEAFRLMPAVQLPLERRVSESGMVLSDGGTFLPSGTLVGINPYVINRDRNIYGSDADFYRPERWLQAKDEPGKIYADRLGRMRATDLTFGAGKRICAGRNLALIECHKLVTSLLVTFDIELSEPKKDWTTYNAWFTRQYDMDVKLTQR